MNKKLGLIIIMLFILIGATVAAGIFILQGDKDNRDSNQNNSDKGQFCCHYFSEEKGESTYYWSDDENCGYQEGTACPGSCPSRAKDESLCE